MSSILGSTPYTNFPVRDQRFRQISGTNLSYLTVNKGLDPNASTIAIIISAGSGNTTTAITNVPGTSGTGRYTRLIGLGQDSTPNFFLLFEVLNPLAPPTYYYWSNPSLPIQNEVMTFSVVTPIGGGGSTIQNLTFIGGNFVWCELPIGVFTGQCYFNNSFPTSGATGISASLATCAKPLIDGINFVCYDTLTGSPGSFGLNVVNSPSPGFNPSTVTTALPSTYPNGGFGVNGNNQFVLNNPGPGGYFLETAGAMVRINATSNSFSAGGPAGFSSTPTTSAAVSATTSIFDVTNMVSGTTVLLTFEHSDIPFGSNFRPLYRSTDGGSSWAEVNLSSLPLAAGGLDHFPSAFGSLIDPMGVLVFINDKSRGGSGLYSYYTLDNGTTWTGPTEVPLPF
ncbi:hypothetical protein CH373_05935 [Leptospira perolatii]|uniref:Exo-alpha-sialidase n=1 Tax=Leptospira perolatii TaxID=2023191 RepID=A0A2M9ZQW9_9LEPT|nr:hypothetical protein CH360_16470 [Leptospira perolatii]PJZ74434.1 hypothetical protein CH373_05935 [Leptospira perolatii]